MDIKIIVIAIVLWFIMEFIKSKIKSTINAYTTRMETLAHESIKIKNEEIKKKDELITNLKLSGVDFEETKKVLMFMIDEYISFIFRNEIDMPHNIRNAERPTTWEGVYMIPTTEKQQEHYAALKTMTKDHLSDSFMDRLRVFYKDSYITHFIDAYIVTEYNRRLRLTMEESRVFRDKCVKNLNDIRKEMDDMNKKSMTSKNEKINRLLKVFGFQEVLPTDPEVIDQAVGVDEIDTMKLFKNRYLLNKRYYDSLKKYVSDVDDVLVNAETFKEPDDKMVTFLSKEYGWNKIDMDPIKIEESKIELVEICLKYDKNPMKLGLFGEHNEPGPFQYTGVDQEVVSLHGHRMNTIFYNDDIYDKGYGNIAEAAFSEGFKILI